MNDEDQIKIVESIKDDLIEILNCYNIPVDQRDIYFKCLNVDVNNIIKEYKRSKLIYEYSYDMRLIDDTLFMRVTIYGMGVYDTDHYIDLEVAIVKKE